MSNSTLPPLPEYTLRPQPPVISWIPDTYLTLILPIVAYWGVSLIFHWIDELDLFPQYRLHTPAEVLKRNHVSRWEVFRDVVLQQIIQTIFGVFLGYLEEEAMIGKDDYDIAVWAQRLRMVQHALPAVLATVGLDSNGIAKNLAPAHPALSSVFAGGHYHNNNVVAAFASWELEVARVIYWFLVPAFQFAFAILVVDTWQYFWHRAMHLNKWLYSKSQHSLYCSYQALTPLQPLSTRDTTVCTSPTRTAPCTTTQSRASCLTHSELVSPLFSPV